MGIWSPPWFTRSMGARGGGPLQPLYLFFVICASALFILNLRSAPGFVKNLLPEGPSTCRTSVNFKCGHCIPSENGRPLSGASSSGGSQWVFDTRRDSMDYGLSDGQCGAAFPGLFMDIDQAVRRMGSSRITKEDMDRRKWPEGSLRAMIYDGQLYVIDAVDVDIPRFSTRVLATLLSLNRAISSYSDKGNERGIPNVEFVLNIDDYVDPDLPVWAYARKHDHNNTWLMPDFGYYSWPEPGLGTYNEVRQRMREVEGEIYSFAMKKPQVVWRGAIKTSPRLRQDLLDRTAHKKWADVKGLVWNNKEDVRKHLMPIGDHCKYMFIVHTEGRAYSGRLKYIQNCRSVIFAHEMQWIQPFEYLMVSDGPNQNFVKIRRDFADLEDKVEYLLAHQDEAERIAENSARTFRDRYLTPAAEACYWRKLIHGWSKISSPPEFYEGDASKRKWRGVPVESYILMRSLTWANG